MSELLAPRGGLPDKSSVSGREGGRPVLLPKEPEGAEETDGEPWPTKLNFNGYASL